LNSTGMKHGIKQITKTVIVKTGVINLANPLARRGIAILRYHSVQERADEFGGSLSVGITHSRKVFEAQMELIKKEYHPLNLDDILDYLENKRSIPRKSVAITFDDGFADNYEIAAPILHRLGIKAAFYVTVNAIEYGCFPWFIRLRRAFQRTRKEMWGNSEKNGLFSLTNVKDKYAAFIYACEKCARLVGSSQTDMVTSIENELDVGQIVYKRPPMMSWNQIESLRGEGHIIGSHTLSHPNVVHISNHAMKCEIEQSKHRLEEKLRAKVIHFSYPSPILEPHWTEVTNEAVKKAGYSTGVTCTPGLVRKQDNPFSLHRIVVPFDVKELHWSLQNAFLGRVL
jgi:peptidoglycan/xylan/chitin deacetylase (PgdA/CDA1 family)